jgi:hypothetical protein
MSRLVTIIYGTTIPESLFPAATRGVLLHLNKLLNEGKVVRTKSATRTAGDDLASDDWRLCIGDESNGAKI